MLIKKNKYLQKILYAICIVLVSIYLFKRFIFPAILDFVCSQAAKGHDFLGTIILFIMAMLGLAGLTLRDLKKIASSKTYQVVFWTIISLCTVIFLISLASNEIRAKYQQRFDCVSNCITEDEEKDLRSRFGQMVSWSLWRDINDKFGRYAEREHIKLPK